MAISPLGAGLSLSCPVPQPSMWGRSDKGPRLREAAARPQEDTRLSSLPGHLACFPATRVGGTGRPHSRESTVGARTGQAGLRAEQGGQESALQPSGQPTFQKEQTTARSPHGALRPGLRSAPLGDACQGGHSQRVLPRRHLGSCPGPAGLSKSPTQQSPSQGARPPLQMSGSRRRPHPRARGALTIRTRATATTRYESS